MEHLYVAQGFGGLFKIGRSSDPVARAKALQREFAARGDKLEKLIPCDGVENAYGIEWTLQCWVAETHARKSGREWFVSGDFEATLQQAQALTAERRKRDAYEQSPRGKAARRREKARTLALQQEWAAAKVSYLTSRAQYKADVAKRRKAKALRVNGAMDAMAAFLLARSTQAA